MTETKRTPRTEDVLRYARNILIERDWCQGSRVRDKYGWVLDSVTSKKAHSFCAVGALELAVKKLKASDNIWLRAKNKLNEAADGNPEDGSIVYFNDHQASSKEDVIGIFNKALK